MRLEDKTAFVTGAGQGIGESTALRFAEEGAHVVASDVNTESVQETAETIEAAGGSAEAHDLDVTDADRFHELVDQVAEERGLDVVVNNAGIGHPPEWIEDTDESVFDYVVNVNVKGVWNGCHAALPHLKEQGSGAIVNVASLAAIFGLPRQGVYSLTKGAVLNFTRAVSAEAGPMGVRANAVCPGFVTTDLGEQFFASRSDPEAAREQMEQRYDLRRLGEAEEIANAILFLASDEASWVTGHGLVVDGGFSTS
ncbi:SDR family NAD(P)-dependent oxidoreductase [Halomarina rubra]|uniref:SDR family NAD(P)-dependent oxidoreductase n=1 Tax=Halomarina rubra TaxID=2071873 RepID=A0ABD6ASN0_9EURY|nr:SDR family oxidoreductase [Halomarina rubra]